VHAPHLRFRLEPNAQLAGLQGLIFELERVPREAVDTVDAEVALEVAGPIDSVVTFDDR